MGGDGLAGPFQVGAQPLGLCLVPRRLADDRFELAGGEPLGLLGGPADPTGAALLGPRRLGRIGSGTGSRRHADRRSTGPGHLRVEGFGLTGQPVRLGPPLEDRLAGPEGDPELRDDRPTVAGDDDPARRK